MRKKIYSLFMAAAIAGVTILTGTAGSVATAYAASNNYTSAQGIYADTPVSGSVSYGEEKWYKYTAASGGHFHFDIKSTDPSTNINVRIYNSGVNEIYNDDGYDVISPEYSFRTGSVIYVKVSWYYDGGSIPKNYTVNTVFTKASNWEKESNDSIDRANKLTAGKALHGTLISNKDTDFYKFTMPYTGHVTFRVKNGNADFRAFFMKVYDKNGNNPASWSNEFTNRFSLDSYQYNVKKGTTFYISVTGGGYDSAYTIKAIASKSSSWETESNDTKQKANKLVTGKAKKATMFNHDDVDWYSFKAKKSGKAKITVSLTDADGDGAELGAGVYNSSLTLLKEDTNISGKRTFSLKVKKGRKYYVRVYNDYQDYSNRRYTVKVK